MTQKVKLTSTGFVHTPGIIRWAENGYRFKPQREQLLNVITSTYGLDKDTVHKLLTGEIPYTVEDDAVIFEKPQN